MTLNVYYDQMVSTYLDATRGNDGPSEIQCAPSTFAMIVNKIYNPWVDIMAAKQRASITDWYWEVLAGRIPLTFMGASIVKSDPIPTNEIHFINAARPELNKILILKDSDETQKTVSR